MNADGEEGKEEPHHVLIDSRIKEQFNELISYMNETEGNLRSNLWNESSLIETVVSWFRGALEKLRRELMRSCLEFNVVDGRLLSRRRFRTFFVEVNDYERMVTIVKRSLDALREVGQLILVYEEGNHRAHHCYYMCEAAKYIVDRFEYLHEDSDETSY